MRVAAYQRLSAPDIEQASSLELLKHSWANRINRCRRYKCVGYYFDEGDSRAGFEKLMEAAENGQIDRIETKSAFDFIDNFGELISTVSRLNSLDPPVRVHFEVEDVTTGTAMWYHCVQFLMGYLESECGKSMERINARLTVRREREPCRI